MTYGTKWTRGKPPEGNYSDRHVAGGTKQVPHGRWVSARMIDQIGTKFGGRKGKLWLKQIEKMNNKSGINDPEGKNWPIKTCILKGGGKWLRRQSDP